MKIAIGSDHAGFELKQYLVRELKTLGHEIIDCGTDSEQAVDYPDYTVIVCGHVYSGDVRYGILICGTGIGVSMAANKMPGIRAALCNSEYSARLARLHNDANVLALGGRVIGKSLALEITRVFLTTEFSAEDRHQRRINKMMSLGEKSDE